MSENNYNQQYSAQPVPSNAGKSQAIVSMVLGLLSVFGSWTVIVSIVMAIVALVLSGKAKAAGNTSAFATVGRITGIIGLILGILAIIGIILYVVIIFVIGVGGAMGSFSEVFNF